MISDIYIEQLESALIDLLEGGNYSWWEIQAQTGCSDERSKEIEELYHEVYGNYKEKHNIS
ncbi:MAG: hypothetical protein GY782_08660 [Gammaproteobacteria bacterium]|nr:hypothetical protein [Gammaproteobacteria bacterium]